ncbi:energy-coupling factor transporter transmembrane protein EcfT [Collinsella sp. AGMB00827]|uniref:Energy-coupling factor transporter transmembrane protein EcfT n=1 Tax=Collinsella ureilytica TaxID=2869515 RepID=A0ABS7MIQ0_9ACTN|nr:energy-coupling factor transporter transmembrane component T [Collinsella urealyticum]MBY4797246.1 energy-coupling factor transporter transmembrane protein EcfT [Collinsella urealyticum]
MLGSSGFGQYLAANSPIHKADPRMKLVVTLIFMVSCFFITRLSTLALAACCALLAAFIARVPASRLVSQLRHVLLFLTLTSVFNLFFVSTGPVVLTTGPLIIHQGGILAALLYTLRFAILLIVGGLLLLTTSPTSLTDAFGALFAPLERLGVPITQASMILSIALRFAPILAREANNVRAAQTARGASFEGKSALAYARASIPILIPLFASALRHAENLGRAMDARAYTGGAKRTHYRIMRLSLRYDLPLAVGLVVYIIGLITLSLM